MNPISEFHSLTHLANDLSGSVMYQVQWERHHVVRLMSHPQQEAEKSSGQVRKRLIKSPTPIIKPEVLISAVDEPGRWVASEVKT